MKAGVIVPVALVSFIMLLSLVGLAVWYSRKKKRRSGGYAAGFVMPSPITPSQISGNLILFTIALTFSSY